MNWLVISVALSVILTVLVNVGLRAFPGAGDQVNRHLDRLASPSLDHHRDDERRIRVFVPWKAMIVGSVILTIVVNLLRIT